MSAQSTKKHGAVSRWFLLCPTRHVILLVSAAAITAYFVLRSHSSVMLWLSESISRPYHRAVAGLCDSLDFSLSAVLIAAIAIAAAIYIMYTAFSLFRGGERLKRIYRAVVSLLCVSLTVYAGFCLLWGVYYYSSSFEEQSGLNAEPISLARLESVTNYFAGLANEYGKAVCRDENGIFAEDLQSIFDASPTLYRQVEALFPCLSGPERRAKQFSFSKALSFLDFTGFFFPFTGEANINIDSPACYIPSTIAHELAHQRGVAAEDEANFVAVLACLENGNPVYCYSACLLAYTHLGNALYSADYNAWLKVYSSLSENVRADISFNREYWSRFETPVSSVSNSVYTGFLQSYGQSLGLKSYGACVDLLTAYYYDASIKE